MKNLGRRFDGNIKNWVLKISARGQELISSGIESIYRALWFDKDPPLSFVSFFLQQATEAQRVSRGIALPYLFITSEPRWGRGGQHHTPAALPPLKTLYPLYRRLGGPQGRSGRVRKISLPPGFDPRTVQPVASRYTDWAIAAQFVNNATYCHLYVGSRESADSKGCGPLRRVGRGCWDIPDLRHVLSSVFNRSSTWITCSDVTSGIYACILSVIVLFWVQICSSANASKQIRSQGPIPEPLKTEFQFLTCRATLWKSLLVSRFTDNLFNQLNNKTV